jgi:hypothetical protein
VFDCPIRFFSYPNGSKGGSEKNEVRWPHSSKETKKRRKKEKGKEIKLNEVDNVAAGQG